MLWLLACIIILQPVEVYVDSPSCTCTYDLGLLCKVYDTLIELQASCT